MKCRRSNSDSTTFRQENLESDWFFSWRCGMRRNRHILERNLGNEEHRREESECFADGSERVRLMNETSVGNGLD